MTVEDWKAPDMTSWGMSYRLEGGERDSNYFSWQDIENGTSDDTGDLFGQFVDMDNLDMVHSGSFITTSAEGIALTSVVPRNSDPFLLDQPPESIGSSTTDELDFLSNSSQVGPTPAGIHDVNPGSNLAATLKREHREAVAQNIAGRASISDTDLPRLEGITLSSPTKNVPVSQPASPIPPKSTRRTQRIVEAVGATIRKATNRRKQPRKPLPGDRPGSPTADVPLHAPRQRPRPGDYGKKPAPMANPPNYREAPDRFVHGACDDPFAEVSHVSQANAMRYFNQEPVSPTTIESPLGKREGSYQLGNAGGQNPASSQWETQQHQASGNMMTPNGHWNHNGMGTPWWDYQDPQVMQQKNAEMNMAMHAQQAELPYEYAALQDTSSSGLMIQMPQSRSSQLSGVGDLALNAHTHLPPPPPPPASERQHRPPRAPSSGARHLSCSPVRRTRAPSASPTRTPGQQSQNRHSSGGSISSVRSASGRLPGSMPGTPCSVRKRRSREPSGSGDIGFVNFTPSDGTVLMTGVAPSGSSKTKARREKEAQERRRKLSEAAIKAVAAAGGDVERLMQQGFAF